MIPRKQTRYDQGDDFSILPCFITVNEVEEADQLVSSTLRVYTTPVLSFVSASILSFN